MDRFDIRIHVPPVPLSEMIDDNKGEGSEDVAARVVGGANGANWPVKMFERAAGWRALREIAEPDARGRKLLARLSMMAQMTARGFNRILRVARAGRH